MNSTDHAARPARDHTESETSAYDEMLEDLDAAISEARRKVESGRVYDAENERVRIKWIRALAYAVDIRRKVQADRDLEELAERVETIEQRRNGEGHQ